MCHIHDSITTSTVPSQLTTIHPIPIHCQSKQGNHHNCYSKTTLIMIRTYDKGNKTKESPPSLHYPA
ncbi:hypothetical protein VTJ04DRAFT_8467 [Mycothermus thermophilus]|uniref:uncharacterized protein n=1 Tax=Humicola insolens TaxID=85995 RepID=UPI00374238B8